MSTNNKGMSLIALIITIAVLIVTAAVTIQNGKSRTDEAKLTKHNINISTIQEEVESYYYYKGEELPVVNLTPYSISEGSTLLAEITKNGEHTDEFYKIDLSKLGKVAGKEGTNISDDIYIVSKTRHNVYYAKGNIVKGITYHGLIAKNDIKLAQVSSILTPTPTTAPSYAYNNPVVPSEFTHIGTDTWDNGFTIQDSNGNQFVWVPALDPRVQPNGTLDNTTFNSKFGRRSFRTEIFNASYFYETNDTAIQNMTASVNKYGGFYIAKYEASNDGSGKGQSKANTLPWVSIDWSNSKLKAESMDIDWGWNPSVVESYLCYGAHWDTALQWLIDSSNKTSAEISTDSTAWGNYWNDTFSGTTEIGNTGQWTQTSAKGIYDLAGNVWEWTMESYSTSDRVYRGGDYNYGGGSYSSAYRSNGSITDNSIRISWRPVLCIY